MSYCITVYVLIIIQFVLTKNLVDIKLWTLRNNSLYQRFIVNLQLNKVVPEKVRMCSIIP